MLNTLKLQKNISYLINKYSNTLSIIELELILSQVLKCSRQELYINSNDMYIDEETEKSCSSLIERRLYGEPVQYVTGSAEFMGMDFIVNKHTFIPRPETELLVNEVLLSDASFQPLAPGCRILDLCTGCGNIAVSLARLMPGAVVSASDISARALNIAQKNSMLHGVGKSIKFYEGDMFEALTFDKTHRFDIIVCNPPYIKSHELGLLQEEVTFEPKQALDGGYDGMGFYRRIAEQAPGHLKKGGSLFLEIGFGQIGQAREIFGSKKIFKVRRVKKDFAGIDRVLWINLS